jgi:integrase
VLDIVSASAEAIGERHEEARQLLAHRSLPLFEIDQGVIDELDAALLHTTPPELHLTAAGKKFDGDEGAVRLVGPIPCAPNYEIRRRAVVRQVLNDAVRRGKLGANPLTSVRSEERTEHPEASQVTPSQVPSPTQIRQIAEKIATGAKSKHYAGLVKMIGLAGPRPSECFRLEWGHLTLPEDGTWGNASITGGTVQPGRRWTGTGTPYKDEALKTKRNKNATRDVPIPPEVVADLLALRESRPDVKFNDRIFVDAKGGIPHEGNLNRLLHRVMTSLFPATPLEKLSLYGLRHSAATTYLNAGVPIHTAARYMGHSPEVMLRIYAACMPDTLQRATDLMDVELAR